MNLRDMLPPHHAYLADTHEVHNTGSELVDYNMYRADRALVEAVHREGAGWADASLADFGRLTGSADYMELGALANRHEPELDTHDRFGRRVDLVRFHPAYHQLMRTAIGKMFGSEVPATTSARLNTHWKFSGRLSATVSSRNTAPSRTFTSCS